MKLTQNTDSEFFSSQYRHLVEMCAELLVYVITMRRFFKAT